MPISSTLPYASVTSPGLVTGGSLFKNDLPSGTAIDISASSGRVYYVELDNTANTSYSFVKLYDAASGSVTVGTTVPHIILRADPSAILKIVVPKGLTFSTALCGVVVTAGGTGGTTAPTNAAILKVIVGS